MPRPIHRTQTGGGESIAVNYDPASKWHLARAPMIASSRADAIPSKMLSKFRRCCGVMSTCRVPSLSNPFRLTQPCRLRTEPTATPRSLGSFGKIILPDARFDTASMNDRLGRRGDATPSVSLRPVAMSAFRRLHCSADLGLTGRYGPSLYGNSLAGPGLEGCDCVGALRFWLAVRFGEAVAGFSSGSPPTSGGRRPRRSSA